MSGTTHVSSEAQLAEKGNVATAKGTGGKNRCLATNSVKLTDDS